MIALRIGRSYLFYSGFRVNGNSRTINNTRELITSWLVHRSVGQKALPLRTPSKVRDPVKKLGLVNPFEFPPIIEMSLLISHQTFHLGTTLLAQTRVLMNRITFTVNSQAIMDSVATFFAFQCDEIGRRMITAQIKEMMGNSGCCGTPKPNMDRYR